jgi:uncharacterized phiE125 gp8 family phage protein
MTHYLGTDDSPEHDALFTRLIAAATDRVESYTGHALISREFTETHICCDWQRRLSLFRAPVVSIASIKVDGDTVDTGDYESIDGMIIFDPPYFANRTVAIVYTAGYGNSPADVPEWFKLGVQRTVADFFEHRENVVVGTIATALPREVMDILAPYRRRLI